MNKPVNPKIMDAKKRFQSGVLQYKQLVFWAPDYAPTASDALALFRITPLEGGDR